MIKGKKKKHGKPDPVDYQFSVKLTHGKPKDLQLTAELLEEVVMYRILHGRNPAGFEVSRVRWRNPATKTPRPEDGTTVDPDGWRESTVSEAVRTLRLKEAARSGNMRFRAIRDR